MPFSSITFPPTFEICSAESLHHIRERNTAGPHFFWRDIDLILPHEATHRGHLRNAGHRVQLKTDKVVLQRAEPAPIVISRGRGSGIDFEEVLINPAEACGIRTDSRDDALRQLPW
jgi:hypothetical protein